MSNSSPVQTQAFLDAQLQPMETPYGRLSKKPTQVRLPERVDQAIRDVEDLSGWLRRVITEAAIKDGLL